MIRGLAIVLVASVAGCQLVGGIEDRSQTGADMPGIEGAGSGGSRGPKAGAGAGAGAGAPKTLCQQYCSTVTKACTGEYAVYGNEEHCLSVCAFMDEGKVGDGVGNTVECRLNAARDISTEPADCRYAGPGGGGVCGDNCDSYCELMSHGCSADEYKGFWLNDLEQCKRKCRGIPDLDEDSDIASDDSHYSALNNDARDHDGDTVQCRLFHATVANTSVAGPPGHCWHAALAPRPDKNGSPNPCLGARDQKAPRCKDYCRLNATACTGDSATYESAQQCDAVCNTFKPGTLKDDGSAGPVESNTLGCRYTHTYNALTATVPEIAATHCGHAGPGGSGLCGDDCTSYCTQLEKTCSAQFAGLGGAAKCQSDCKALLGDAKGVPYSVKLAKSGSSPLACRLLGLARAVTDAKAVATGCEIAVGRGECK